MSIESFLNGGDVPEDMAAELTAEQLALLNEMRDALGAARLATNALGALNRLGMDQIRQDPLTPLLPAAAELVADYPEPLLGDKELVAFVDQVYGDQVGAEGTGRIYLDESIEPLSPPVGDFDQAHNPARNGEQ